MADKVLFVVTSTKKLGDTGRNTGVHFEELATPYWVLADAGYEVDVASTAGGEAPIDNLKPRGENPESVERFLDDQHAMDKVRLTKRLDGVRAEDYVGVYLPGGHGTMWDFPTDERLGRLLATAFEQGRLVAAVCHGPAGFVGARLSGDRPLVEGRRVNSFTDAEEQAVELDGVVPFLLESKLREQGARFEGAGKFESIVVEDANLLTGQNPASAKPLAERLVEKLAERPAEAA
jgi:putative intracellular protease/amidase